MTKPYKIHGIYVHLNKATSDGRMIREMTYRDFPLPLLSVIDVKEPDGNYKGSRIVGQVDKLWQEGDDVMINATITDDDTIQLVQFRRPNTIGFQADIDDAKTELDEEGLYVFSTGRATACHLGTQPVWDDVYVRDGWHG